MYLAAALASFKLHPLHHSHEVAQYAPISIGITSRFWPQLSDGMPQSRPVGQIPQVAS
jgi:hypothetical protein